MKTGKVTTRTGQKRDRARPAVRDDQKQADAPADSVVVPFSTAVAPAFVRLEADCTARHAEQLKASLLKQIDASGQVSLDITAIERIDTVSLQVLAAFVCDRIRAGRQIVWAGHNEIFSRSVRLLGLATALNSPEVP